MGYSRMNSIELAALAISLAIGIGVGYDAERWNRSVNGWSLLATVLSVVGLAIWLVVRHLEADRRAREGLALPTPLWRWLRLRRRRRRLGTG